MSDAARIEDRRRAARERLRLYRERKRRQGLRQIRLWVPDVNAPGFAEEARRQSRLVAESPGEHDDQAFIDSITDHGD